MMDVLKWLARFIPRDPQTGGGFGPFRLPERARWMNVIFEYHDLWYDIGPDSDMRLSEIDWKVFKALAILAESEPDLIKRCQKVHDICKYWSIMRSAGHYLYNRHKGL
jgi:hypothetical protein